MTVRAYILIQTEVGSAGIVADAVRNIAGIASSCNVTGPHDVIAVSETDSMEELGRIVVTKIQGIDGITRTITCPIISGEERLSS